MGKIEERETYTGYAHNDERCYLYSGEPTWIKFMKGLLEKYPDDVRWVLENSEGMEIEYPINWLTIKPDKKPVRKSRKHG